MNIPMLGTHLLLALGLGIGFGLVVSLVGRFLLSAGRRSQLVGTAVAAFVAGLGVTLLWFHLDPIKSDHAFAWRFWHLDHPLAMALFLYGPPGLMLSFLIGLLCSATIVRSWRTPGYLVLGSFLLGFLAMWHDQHEVTPPGSYSWVNIEVHKGNAKEWVKSEESLAYRTFAMDWFGPHLSGDHAWQDENPPKPYLVISKDYSNGKEKVADGMSITLYAPFTYQDIKDAVWQVASSRAKPSLVAPKPAN